ncbi:MAG: acyltransferase [Bacteroidetes bacterium]|nr:acyltransferase [Bacteroidota bacterium]
MNNTHLRFDALTGIRCIAASMVFVYHNRKYWRGFMPQPLLQWVNEWHMGVSLFFVLSGFLIAWTYGRQPLQSGKDYLRYFLQRMARILPVYWLVLSALYLDFGVPKNVSLLQTYSLFHAFSGQNNLDGISQAWTLNIELCFYALAPILFLLALQRPLRLLLLMITLPLAAAGLGWLWHVINGNPQEFLYPPRFVLTATFFGRSFEFVAGMALVLHLRHGKFVWLQKVPHKTILGGISVALCLYAIGLFEPDIFHHGADRTGGLILSLFVFPICTALWLLGLIQEKTGLQRFLSTRFMVLLGNASFAFYLLHLSYANIRLRGWVLWADRNFLLLWVLSVVVYLLFEKPVYNRIRHWLKAM